MEGDSRSSWVEKGFLWSGLISNCRNLILYYYFFDVIASKIAIIARRNTSEINLLKIIFNSACYKKDH